MPFFEFESHDLHYRLRGEGPLLVILPGNTASSASHDAEIDYFSRRHRVAALDYLGTGKSGRLDTWPDDWLFQCARQAKALADHLSDEPCFFMGVSGGGAVALLTAIHFPEKAAAIAADSCVEIFSPDALRAEVDERKNAPDELREFWEQAHGSDWRRVVEADGKMLLEFADRGGDCFRGRLGEIKCPVLLSASLQDSALENVAGQTLSMAGQITGAEAYLCNSGDHPLMWSEPERYREAAGLFLKRIANRF